MRLELLSQLVWRYSACPGATCGTVRLAVPYSRAFHKFSLARVVARTTTDRGVRRRARLCSGAPGPASGRRSGRRALPGVSAISWPRCRARTSELLAFDQMRLGKPLDVVGGDGLQRHRECTNRRIARDQVQKTAAQSPDWARPPASTPPGRAADGACAPTRRWVRLRVECARVRGPRLAQRRAGSIPSRGVHHQSRTGTDRASARSSPTRTWRSRRQDHNTDPVARLRPRQRAPPGAIGLEAPPRIELSTTRGKTSGWLASGAW